MRDYRTFAEEEEYAKLMNEQDETNWQDYLRLAKQEHEFTPGYGILAARAYTKENYPHFIVNHGNWDICANDKGYCAAIPTEEGAADGCQASHFGDLNYVKVTLGIAAHLIKYTIEDTYASMMGSYWATWIGDADNTLPAREGFIKWCKERGANPKDFYYRRHIVNGETTFR